VSHCAAQFRIREVQESYVNDTLPQSTLRQMRKQFSDPRAWVTLTGVSLVLGIAGPFQTLDQLGLVPRVAYWTAVVFGTFFIGSLMSCLTMPMRQARPVWIGLSALALIDSVCVVVWLFLLNWLVFGVLPAEPGYAVSMAINATVVSFIIVIVFYMFEPKPPAPTADVIPLLDRIEFDKRGPLISLSVEDHYTNVHTTKGTALVLMRLGDAMRKVGPTAGLQVHRSHWVATDHIISAQRKGDRAELKMHDGTVIPVSRSYIPAIRDAGFLPTRKGTL
jgi:hypothetical protein